MPLVPDSPELNYSNSRKYYSPTVQRVTSTETVVSVNSSHWRISPSFGVTIPRYDGPLSSRPVSASTARSRLHSVNHSNNLSGTCIFSLSILYYPFILPFQVCGWFLKTGTVYRHCNVIIL